MKAKQIMATAMGWILGCVATGAASAGVITGTGVPSATALGATDAVGFTVADKGAGHLLVVPYFTAQAGQASVLVLLNTDQVNGKVVKLRYRGAGNGDSLLSLQVLLSPGDVWTASVTAGPDGIAQLSTVDRTCTYPALAPGVAQAFQLDRLNPAATPEQRANQTREGLIEAIVTADIPFGSASNTANSALATAIRQVNGVAPCTPAVLDGALRTDASSEAEAAGRGFAAPTGGVAATWSIIDVPGSTTFSGAATVFRAVNAAGKNARGNFVLFPQTTDIVTAPERFTSDPLLVSAGLASRQKSVNGTTSQPSTAAAVVARSHDLPDLSTPYYLPAGAVNARTTAGDLSRLLSTTRIDNQYATEDAISSKTDWLFSLPTKRYSVGVDYSVPAPTAQNALLYSVVPPQGDQYFSSDNLSLRGGAACTEEDDFVIFDREITRRSKGPVYTLPPSGIVICGAVSVLAFRDPGRSALGASVTRDTYYNSFVSGWMSLSLPTSGVPILGHSFIRLTNPNATPGTVGNYGLLFPHSGIAP